METTVEYPYFSPSRLATWKNCPKRHDYAYNKALKPKGRKSFFDKGLYAHELLHVYYQLLQSGTQKPGSDFVVAAIISRIKQDIKQHLEPENLEIYNSVMKMISRYLTHQSPKIDRDIFIEGIEYEIQVPSVTPNGQSVTLYGFLDLLYKDNKGTLRVRDHKTGTSSKNWTPETVEADFQLLFYGATIYRLRGEAPPRVEINFCSTYDYKGEPSDNQFKLVKGKSVHSEKVYNTFLAETLQLIDEVIESKPTPHYSSQCVNCPFYTPCKMEREGVSSENILRSNYEVIDRSELSRPKPFTQNDTNGD